MAQGQPDAAPEDSTPRYSKAHERHLDALRLAQDGVRDDDDKLIMQAAAEFEAALNLIPKTKDTAAFRWRATINLATALRRLGRIAEAIGWLEQLKAESNGAGSAARLPDDARALNSLGSAYLVSGRYRDASMAYRQSLDILGSLTKIRRPDVIQLRAHVLSNLALTYVEASDADLNLDSGARAQHAIGCAEQALALVPKGDDPLGWARTQKVYGDAKSLQAALLEAQDALPRAVGEWQAAINALQLARPVLEGEGADRDSEWAPTMWTLAEASRHLGNLLVGSEFIAETSDQSAAAHFRRAVAAYSEVFPLFREDEERRLAVGRLNDTLLSLIKCSPGLADIWLGISALCQVIGHYKELPEVDSNIINLINTFMLYLGWFLNNINSPPIVNKPYMLTIDGLLSKVDALLTPRLADSARREAVLEVFKRTVMQAEEEIKSSNRPLSPSPGDEPSFQSNHRPRWETRSDEDFDLTPDQFVAKHYANERAAVTPRPIWTKDGPYGNRPAEFIAMAYAPEMMAGTLHRAMVSRDQPNDVITKLLSWLRSHPMPEGVDIPTLPEWNTRQVEAQQRSKRPLGSGRMRTGHARLHDAMRYRNAKI